MEKPKRPNDIDIGRRLHERRTMLGISLRDAARYGKIASHSTIRDYENGRTRVPAFMVKKYAPIYHCSVQDFYKPPGSPWTEHKLPRRTAAPLRMHAPTKHLDVNVRFPMNLPPLTKTMAEVRALKKWMRCRNDLSTSILFGANNSGMGAVLDMLSGSLINSVSISHHVRSTT